MGREEAAPKRVVMVVPNRIDGDSRVQKAAASIAAAGWETHLIGLSVTGKQEHYDQDGARIHKIPMPKMDPPLSLRRIVAAVRFPLSYTDADRAKRRDWHIKAARIEVDALRGGGGGRGGLRLPLIAHRVGRKVERVWIGRRIRQTKAREKFLGRDDGRWERIERRWWGLLLGDRAWRRLDVTVQRFELAARPEILKLDPDLLHAHDAYSIGVCVRAAARLRRKGKDVKVVYDAHEFVPGHDGLAPQTLEAQSRWERQHLHGADAVVTVSRPLAKLLKEHHGLDREPAVVHNAPLAHPAARPHPGDVRSDCGLDDDTPLAVYSGWASPERQLEVMVEAARLVPDLHMAFLVSRRKTNPYVKRLVKLAEGYGIADRLHFRGYVDYEDLPRFLETADMGIHPMPTGSANHEIALPNKFFEYCHARLPLVVTEVKTLSAEVRRLGNGEVFESGNARSLADAIGRILADKDAYRRAYRDPALLSEYSWEHQALEYVRIYQELIGAAPRGIGEAPIARDELRERTGAHEGTPVVVVLDPGADDAWTDAALRGLASLSDVTTALVCPDPGRRTRCVGRVPAGVAVVGPTGPIASFLSTAAAVVLPRPDRSDVLPPDLALALNARIPVIAPDSPQACRFVEDHDVGEIAEADPDSVVAAVRRVLAGAYPVANVRIRTRVGSGTPWPPLTDDTPIRLGMGTANYAAQLAEIARAVSWHRPDVSVEVSGQVPNSVFRFPADIQFDRKKQSDREFQLSRMGRVLGSYTHLISDAFRPVFGYMNGPTVAGDLEVLRDSGVRTALLMHGSEIRDPDAHLARHEHSPFLDAPPDVLMRLRKLVSVNREIVAESGLPQFVTTPDLIDDVPKARWIPLTVDVDRWYCDAPVMERRRPVVLHAPSARWTKGTDLIIPVLQRLHDAGTIEFRLVEGLPPARMRALVRSADIVVDQVVLGIYSTFSVEAMAAGKPVIAYLYDSTIERMGTVPPIVNATARTLADAIASLMDDRDRAREIGLESLRFARRMHDGRAAAEVLREFLDG